MLAKILYAASTSSHLRRFHQPYIETLRRDADVYLMATEGDGIDFPLTFSKSFFSFGNFRTVFRIRRILKREKFDKVIVHTSLAAFLVRAAMIGMRHRPYVLNVVHGYLFPKDGKGLKNKLLLRCEKMLRKKTDDIAVMNREDAEIAAANRLCLGKVYEIRGMGLPEIDIPEVSPELRAKLHPNDGDILCTFVGELSNRKNQTFLLDAVAALRAAGLPVRLLLAGEGSERESLEKKIRELGLSDTVELPGNLEPIHPYLAATDLYVSASLSEGLPFNVMEAMACGLPAVLSATKGQTDLVPDGTSGNENLYPSGDVGAFCDRVRRIIQSGTLGVGAVTYPQLGQYLLSSVLEENLKIWKEGI